MPLMCFDQCVRMKKNMVGCCFWIIFSSLMIVSPVSMIGQYPRYPFLTSRHPCEGHLPEQTRQRGLIKDMVKDNNQKDTSSPWEQFRERWRRPKKNRQKTLLIDHHDKDMIEKTRYLICSKRIKELNLRYGIYPRMFQDAVPRLFNASLQLLFWRGRL